MDCNYKYFDWFNCNETFNKIVSMLLKRPDGQEIYMELLKLLTQMEYYYLKEKGEFK